MPKVRYIGHNPVKLAFGATNIKIVKDEVMDIVEGPILENLLQLSNFELVKEDKKKKETEEV